MMRNLVKGKKKIHLEDGLECDKCGDLVKGLELQELFNVYQKRQLTFRIINNWIIPCFLCLKCRKELAEKALNWRIA